MKINFNENIIIKHILFYLQLLDYVFKNCDDDNTDQRMSAGTNKNI